MATTVSTAVLKAVPLFASFPEDQLRMLTTMVTRRSATRNTTIMAGGDATDSLYIVLSGRLKVMMSDSDGKEVILSILGPGEFFGEMGLIDDEPRSASVVTIEPCELLSISKRDFKKCLQDNAEMSMAVMRGLLLDMAENVNGEKVVTKRLPKQDIAKMIGASREMVSRVMKDLQTGGYIEMRGSNIVLRDTIMLPE
jgi:CRP/FNR family cyclic AMP-dependent transcriptional regulator